MSTVPDNSYQVTARKWRPSDFTSVVGQDHVTRTIQNAIVSDRLHHAYLFCGPRGVGKTTTARILAKSLNCTDLREDGNPCSSCDSCREITDGRSMDVIEIDGASNNSVDDVRGLRDSAKYAPVSGRYKVFVIDEVHMLSTSAFNALLKTLEEPPKHLIFIFATTEPHKVLATILSRCQRFDFRRMQIEDIVDRLELIASVDGTKPEKEALQVIARKADGSMRDAQSIFDQVTAFCGANFTYKQVNEALNLVDQEFYFRVTDMMQQGELAVPFVIVDEIMTSGFDPIEFLIGLSEHLRNLLAVSTTGTIAIVESTDSLKERYVKEGSKWESGDLVRALHLTLKAQLTLRNAPKPRLRMELLLVQLASMDSTVLLKDVLSSLESKGADEPSELVDTMVHKSLTPIVETKGIESSSSTSINEQKSSTDLRNFPVKRESASERVPPSGNTQNPKLSVDNATDSVTIEDVRSRWDTFLSSNGNNVGLMFALHPAALGSLSEGVLELLVGTEFERNTIDQSRTEITNSIKTFFKVALDVEGRVVDNNAVSTNKNSSKDRDNQSNVDEHPFIEGIVKRLGAIRLP